MLSLIDFGINPGETSLEFSERVDSLVLATPVSFREISEIFNLARYSTENITDEQRQLMWSFYKPFCKRIQKQMGTLKFFIYRFLLGRF